MDIGTCNNVAERLNRPSSEVLAMPVGREYFFRRGQQPIVTERYDFFHDPLYAGRNRKKTRTRRCKDKEVTATVYLEER